MEEGDDRLKILLPNIASGGLRDELGRGGRTLQLLNGESSFHAVVEKVP